MNEREHLAPRPCGTRALAQVDRLIDQPLEPQPLAQRARQEQPRIGDQSLIVELDTNRIAPHDRLRTVHHMSDLLTSGRGCSNQPLFACSGGHFVDEAGQIEPNQSVD